MQLSNAPACPLKMTSSSGVFGTLNCCHGCEMPILDRYFTCVGDQTWHQECLRCVACRVQLTERCYERNGEHFCRHDFLRIFSPPCPTCNRTIMPTDVVRLVGSVAFHPECFCCSLCSRYLSTGDEYRPLGNGQRVICLEHEASIRKRAGGEDLGSTRSPQRTDMSLTEEDGEVGMENGELSHSKSEVFFERHHEHYDMANVEQSSHFRNYSLNEPEKSNGGDSPMYSNTIDLDDQSENGLGDISSLQEKGNSGLDEAIGSPNSGETLSTPQVPSSSGGNLQTKRRGPRTTIKAKQLDTLKQTFATTPKPTRHIREQLAKETGLTMRVIQVWFQNRRSKERRMKQLSVLGVRRPSFRHHSFRRMRPGLRDGSGGLMAEDLPPELMAELLNLPPGYPGICCPETQRDFYKAIVTESASGLAVGLPAFPYGASSTSPPPPSQPHPPPHLLGYPTAAGGGVPRLPVSPYEPPRLPPSPPQEVKRPSVHHPNTGEDDALPYYLDNGYSHEKIPANPDGAFNPIFIEPASMEHPLFHNYPDETPPAPQHPLEASTHLFPIKTDTPNSELSMLKCTW